MSALENASQETTPEHGGLHPILNDLTEYFTLLRVEDYELEFDEEIAAHAATEIEAIRDPEDLRSALMSILKLASHFERNEGEGDLARALEAFVARYIPRVAALRDARSDEATAKVRQLAEFRGERTANGAAKFGTRKPAGSLRLKALLGAPCTKPAKPVTATKKVVGAFARADDAASGPSREDRARAELKTALRALARAIELDPNVLSAL